MSFAQEYSRIYNEVYRAKDYQEEADFVLRLTTPSQEKPLRWLDLCCGTGQHAHYFARHGHRVTGVDKSPFMIAQARKKNRKLKNTCFLVHDMTRFRHKDSFDVITILFHSVCYLKGKKNLFILLQNLKSMLRPDGKILFDFWNTPAVLMSPPRNLVKEISTCRPRILRVTAAMWNARRHQAKIRFHFIYKSTGRLIFSENHVINCFSRKDIASACKKLGMRIMRTGAGLTRAPLKKDSWYGWCLLSK